MFFKQDPGCGFSPVRFNFKIVVAYGVVDDLPEETEHLELKIGVVGAVVTLKYKTQESLDRDLKRLDQRFLGAHCVDESTGT